MRVCSRPERSGTVDKCFACPDYRQCYGGDSRYGGDSTVKDYPKDNYDCRPGSEIIRVPVEEKLTKRERFCMEAMNGALRAIITERGETIGDIKGFAEDCIKIADAVIAAEERTRKP